MRTLIVTCGLPGSGKSTFLSSQGLDIFTISPDNLRLSYGSIVMGLTGSLEINAENDAMVWKQVNYLIEHRMKNGELIIVDATHSNRSYYDEYSKLAQKYRYKCYVLDFRNVPVDVCQSRNRSRPEYKIVPDDVMINFDKRLRELQIPKHFHVIEPQKIADIFDYKPNDYSNYSKVHFLGDIQGCYDPLLEYFQKYPFSSQELYIFVGDYLDRGKQNAEVLNYIFDEFLDKPNIIFIEGNHELHLWHYITNQEISSREFTGRTLQQLQQANIDKSKIRKLIGKLRDFEYFYYDNKKILVCHGGISNIPSQPQFIRSKTFIKGTGSYENVGQSDDFFIANTDDNCYLIHGHRNRQNYPLQYNSRVFNLEGKVEFGGHLRVVQLSAKGFEAIEIENKINKIKMHPQNASYINTLNRNKYIKRLELPGDITSYVFKKEVFYKQIWNDQTITARGLFINNRNLGIAIRSYDKFFNINERPDLTLENLNQKLVYPIHVYLKENGYLGLVGYNEISGQLIFASKSTTEGQFATWFKELFLEKYSLHINQITEYLANNNCSLVFEVIKSIDDPHIVEYDQDKVVLLEIVRRQFQYEALSYQELINFAKEFGFEAKKLVTVINNYDDLKDFIKTSDSYDYKLDGRRIEGFVLSDNANYLFKHKTKWYSYWKSVRNWLESYNLTGTVGEIKLDYFPEISQQIYKLVNNRAHKEQKFTLFSIRKSIEDSKEQH